MLYVPLLLPKISAVDKSARLVLIIDGLSLGAIQLVSLLFSGNEGDGAVDLALTVFVGVDFSFSFWFTFEVMELTTFFGNVTGLEKFLLFLAVLGVPVLVLLLLLAFCFDIVNKPSVGWTGEVTVFDGLQDMGCVSKVLIGVVVLVTTVHRMFTDFSSSEYICNRLFGVMLRYWRRGEGLNTDV